MEIIKFMAAFILISLVIVFAVTVSRKHLELEAETRNLRIKEKAASLAYAIAGGSDILVKDEYGQKLKGIIDSGALKGSTPSCCGYHEYEYYVTIDDKLTKSSWVLGDKDYIESSIENSTLCGYTDTPAVFSVPVAVKVGSTIDPALMTVKLYPTPLSRLAMAVSLSCQTKTYNQTVYVYGIDSLYDGVYVDSSRVCIAGRCKPVSCDGEVYKSMLNKCKDKSLCEKGCYPIVIKSEKRGVYVYVWK